MSRRAHDPGTDGAQRMRGSLGVTLVEYALIVALVVVPAIPAVNWLSKTGRSEVASQKDCVSKRPPPTSCQSRVATTTTTADPSTSSTSIPTSGSTVEPPSSSSSSSSSSTSSSSTSSTTAPPPNKATATGRKVSSTVGEATIVVKTDGGTPAPGSLVEVTWSFAEDPSQSFFDECVTDATGTCVMSFTVPYTGVKWVYADIFITSDPPVATQPPRVSIKLNN